MHCFHQLSGRIQHHSGPDGERDETCPTESRRAAPGFRGVTQHGNGRGHGTAGHGARFGVVVAVGAVRVAALTVKLHLPVIACPSRLRTCQVTVRLPPVIAA